MRWQWSSNHYKVCAEECLLVIDVHLELKDLKAKLGNGNLRLILMGKPIKGL